MSARALLAEPVFIEGMAHVEIYPGRGEAIGINGKEVGRARISNTVAGRFGIDTFGVGSDTGSPVTDTYKAPFRFTGRIERVDIELGPRNLAPKDEKKLHEMHTAFAGAHD